MGKKGNYNQFIHRFVYEKGYLRCGFFGVFWYTIYTNRQYHVLLLPTLPLNDYKTMSTFLQKLKRGGINPNQDAQAATELAANPAQAEAPAGVIQLPVDVYQSNSEIVIYAQIPGADISTLDVSIEGDNDVLVVQGAYDRPEDVAAAAGVSTGEFSFEECNWGQFYRQIILPQEIDSERAEAKVKDGVLILSMPLKGVAEKKIRMNIVKIGDRG